MIYLPACPPCLIARWLAGPEGSNPSPSAIVTLDGVDYEVERADWVLGKMMAIDPTWRAAEVEVLA